MLNNGSQIYVSSARIPGKSAYSDLLQKLFNDVDNNKKSKKLEVERVTYNPPATILHFNDGTKTVVKTSIEDSVKYDPAFGYLMAYFQKLSGMTKTQVGKLMNKVYEDYSEQQEKKIKKVKKDSKTTKNLSAECLKCICKDCKSAFYEDDMDCHDYCEEVCRGTQRDIYSSKCDEKVSL